MRFDTIYVLVLLRSCLIAFCQSTVKGGFITSTLKLTAIKNQTSSLIFGSSVDEVRMSADPKRGFVIETATAPLMSFKSDNTIQIGAQEVSIKRY